MSKNNCFRLVYRKNQRRSGTAVLIFPGLIPTYSDLDGETRLFSQFGDVLEFHYPEKREDIIELYRDVTDTIRKLKYQKIILLGVSFGGTLAYLLMRYWRKQRLNLGLASFVVLSTPFEPTNLTPRSQFQLDFGVTLDKYARKVFIWVVRVLKFIWRFSFGFAWRRYAEESTLQQTVNGVRMGYILRQDWVVKDKFFQVPALLLNTQDSMADPFVLRENELDFLDIFPHGRVMRGLKHHADLNGIAPTMARQVADFIRVSLREQGR